MYSAYQKKRKAVCACFLQAAEQLKRQLSLQYGVPMYPPRHPSLLQQPQAASITSDTLTTATWRRSGSGGCLAHASGTAPVDASCSSQGHAGAGAIETEAWEVKATSPPVAVAVAVDSMIVEAIVRPHTARRAALALLRSASSMPLPRVR